jgi:tRNA threonylcarbamoyladenosine modification (KEOPS) complex Cgi121 subunit
MNGTKADSPALAPDAWFVKVGPGMAGPLMDRMLRIADESGISLLIIKADMTFGPDHLASAWYHARKAFDEGRNSSDSLAMETLLYASGERQLSSAIRKMGVDGDTTGVVVARLTPGEFEPEEGWIHFADVGQKPEGDRLARFGISPEEMGTIDEEDWLDLVLERVAAVDLIRK